MYDDLQEGAVQLVGSTSREEVSAGAGLVPAPSLSALLVPSTLGKA